MKELGILLGSGGVLSHAPRRAQAALMMMDAFQPEGITQLAVDSVFMTPHLGVLASTHPDIAAEVFDKDCLVRLGTCITPTGKGKDGRTCLTARITFRDGRKEEVQLPYGSIKVVKLPVGEKAQVELVPDRGFDVGSGVGKNVTTEVEGGLVGIIFDGRGRPIEVPSSVSERVAKLMSWIRELDAYPIDVLEQYQQENPLGVEAVKQEKGGNKSGIFGRLFGR